MVRINKLYTRTGDTGSTRLAGGAQVRKDSRRIEAIGEVDELNTHVGIARTVAETQGSPLLPWLEQIQNELFDLGADLAAPAERQPEGGNITAELVTRLEGWIDECTSLVPELRSFVLPGGSPLNAQLHLCRAVCRRAERRVVALASGEHVAPVIGTYLNRLSDLFFALSRRATVEEGAAEYLWIPRKQF